MLTNRLNLPSGLVAAIGNDPYHRGDSDISITQLIGPAYQRILRARVEIVEDVADRIWSLVGQVGHAIIERAYKVCKDESDYWVRREMYTKLGIWEKVADAEASVGLEVPLRRLTPAEFLAKHGVVAERRIDQVMAGWKVSGQFDVIEKDRLLDYKFTSVWSVIGDPKEEWTAQLNCLRFLAHHNGMEINSLGIVAVLRDWSKGKANSANYPPLQTEVVEIEVWPLAKTEAYMLERVKAHQDANPPVCSDEERWKKGDVFAVMKEGRKSAIRLHEDKSAADAHASELGAHHSVVTRPGGYTRCENYCNVVHECAAMKTEAGF